MSKADLYRQVALLRENAVDVAWVPIALAKVGKILRVRVGDNDWQDGWLVTAIYEARSVDELQIQRWAQKRWADVLTVSDE